MHLNQPHKNKVTSCTHISRIREYVGPTKQEALEDASGDKAQRLRAQQLSGKRPAPSADGEAGRAAAAGTGTRKRARTSAPEPRAVSPAKSTACAVPLGRSASAAGSVSVPESETRLRRQRDEAYIAQDRLRGERDGAKAEARAAQAEQRKAQTAVATEAKGLREDKNCDEPPEYDIYVLRI
jgi:hypothetical protein